MSTNSTLIIAASTILNRSDLIARYEGETPVVLDSNEVPISQDDLDLVVAEVQRMENQTTLPTRPILSCLANLNISDFDVTGIETSTGLSVAFMMDIGVVWVFFSKPMSNMKYSWNVSPTTGRANVTSRSTEHLEIALTDDTGSPVNTAEISIQIFEVV